MPLNINELKSSQIPALQLLANLGYEILPPSAALKARGGSTDNVLLEGILRDQLSKINRIHYKGGEYLFSEANVQTAVQKLKDLRYDGWEKTHEAIYDLLTLPTALRQTIEGDSRSFGFKYVDWEDINNNVFHAVAEFSVERTRSREHARPDIVLFVNGIPVCVIECKAPDEPVEAAVSQHIRNQGSSYIPKLFSYVQLLLATNVGTVQYATTGTSEKFWGVWKELEDKEEPIRALVNEPLSADQKDALFVDEFKRCRKFFDATEKQDRLLTAQDKAIYSLCRPQRLLDLTYRFIVFEHGVKKIARHQQFFVVRNTLKRVKQYNGNRREGGIIWHTQGSGKSLTMVMLVRALALDTDIPNRRILLVTDRTDLDKQLGNTFKACGLDKKRATSGRNLIQHLKDKTDIITTLIHKFDKALTTEKHIDDSADMFVLVDESHRTNFAFFAARMRKMLPNACYIGFTGTPLLKEEKNSFYRFGRLIEPHYPIEQAVADKAIVPLLYEARLVNIGQDKATIDLWFERHTAGLTDEQKADLKSKYARANILNQTDKVIHERAFDISMHYKDNWQDTGFKAQLVAPSQLAAIKYHNHLDVSSEVVISSPDPRKGYQGVDEDSTDEVVRFWKRMMARYGSAEEYEKQIIERFKHSEEPEIIIVVDKLLTGFDAPRNAVLYLCKGLREHNLLQAIARVNRIHEGKDHGYVVDYESALKELNKALTMYEAFSGFDEEDIAKTLIAVNEEVDKLPQKYSDLWAIFKEVENKNDMEALQEFLADKERRDEFYKCLTEYSNTLGIALSTDKFLLEVDDEELNRHRGDLKDFMKLRQAVQLRYAEKIDFGVYERKIEKLLDAHIQAGEVIHLIEPLDILDGKSIKAVMEGSPVYSDKVGKSDAAKADMIAHAAAKIIKEKMEEDPAFYEKFSKLIQKAIDDFRQRRISEAEYLNIVTDAGEKVASHTHDDVPDSIKENRDACAYYGVIQPHFANSAENNLAEKIAAQTSLFVQKTLKEEWKVDFWYDMDAQNLVKNAIDDYLHDAVKARFNISLNDEQMDDIIDKVMRIAMSRSHLR